LSKSREKLDLIVKRCKAGEEAAYNELFRLIRSDVHHIILRSIGADGEMDDIIQTALMEVFRSIKNFQGKSQFSTWLYRVVVNVAYQQIRKRKKNLPPVDVNLFANELVSNEADPEKAVRQMERARQLQEIIQQLPAKKRIVFMLHEVEGYTPQEIAEMLDCSKFTIKSRLFYARKEFNRLIRQQAVFVSQETSGGESEDDK